MLNFTYSDENSPRLKEAEMRNLLIWVKERRRLSLLLRSLSYVSVTLIAAAGAVTVYSAYRASLLSAVGLLISLGVPFVAVTLLRRIINAARPYEVYSDVFDTVPKRRSGASFPSRHAYSAFAIAVCAFPVSAYLGCALLIISAVLCVSRVLLGVHFVRDVAAGALIGIISQIIGLLLIQPF